MGRTGELLSRIGHLHDGSREHEDGFGGVLALEHVPGYGELSVARQEAELAAAAS
jgi:hypothetical protein